MAKSTFLKIGKKLLGSTFYAPKKKSPKRIKVINHFKTRNDLANLSAAEKTACDVFAQFYGPVNGALTVSESSLPLTLYVNFIRTFADKLYNDPSPAQYVSALWNEMKIAEAPKEYASECKYNSYLYAPNHQHEKVLLFAGLMVVVGLAIKEKEKLDAVLSSLRIVANANDNKEYFAPFDKAINVFSPSEVTITLEDAIRHIKTAIKPYKALSLYEMLCTLFAHDEQAVAYIKTECEGVDMSEPEVGTRIANVNVMEGGAMNMMDNCSIQKDETSLLSNSSQKQLGHED